MGAISATDIISIIQGEIENINWDEQSRETGEVIWVGDGIVTVYGIDHAMYGEIVAFENGVKGMVQDVRQNEIGIILFGRDTGIKEGTKVVRTKKKAGIPVGDAFVGRVINALGEPIDGNGDVKEDDYRPIEQEAPGIIDRQSADTPMETGILSIDSMFPIGRGQRELIIGDRQTGKTAIAIDTIIPTIIPSNTWLDTNLKNISLAFIKYLSIILQVLSLNIAEFSLLTNFNIWLLSANMYTDIISVTNTLNIP